MTNLEDMTREQLIGQIMYLRSKVSRLAMTGWVMKTEFVTETPLEHGNWSSVEFETADEAWAWWDAKPTRSVYPRNMTLTAPDGRVWASRFVPSGMRLQE